MAYVIKKKETFFWPIKLKNPIDDGKFEEQTIDFEFKKLKKSELLKLLNDKDLTAEIFCKKIIINWKDVKDEGGTSAVFSEDALNDFLESYSYPKEIMSQYIDALGGVVEKN